MEQLLSFVGMVNEMSPYLLLGFLFAGLLHVFVPQRVYAQYLGRPDFRSTLLATLFGIPLPLCSCGVLPTAMSLHNEGASKGATTSFLIATPQTGVDSIMATYSLMGLPFAIVRPVAAIVTALVGGNAMNLIDRTQPTAQKACADDCDCHSQPQGGKLFGALRYAFIDMFQSIGKWLAIGLLLAGLITVAVPDGFFERHLNSPLESMLFVLLLSIPMYLCATGSIPVAAALMLKGLSPGTALVLLMAGPATSMESIVTIRKIMGSKPLAVYLATIIAGAVGFGLAIDYLLPAEWFVPQAVIAAPCHSADDFTLPQILCSLLFVGLTVNGLIPRRAKQPESPQAVHYQASGIECAHCKQTVETALLKLDGVRSVTVDISTNVVSVEGDVAEADIKRTIEGIGFGFVGKIDG